LSGYAGAAAPAIIASRLAAPFAVPAPVAPLRIVAYTVTSAAGVGKAALLEAMRENRSALVPNDFGPTPLPTWIGRVAGIETAPLPEPLASWECRNNRLAWLGLNGDGFIDAVQAARARHGAARIALVLGTSTSSIGATEDAYRALDADGAFPADNCNPRVHTPHSLAAFVHEALALAGPCLTVSTACSSSAKVFASAERLLRLGVVDAAVVGGVDSLCGSVLFGFNALQLVSPEPCRPFDAERSGISIGEAAGFALLEREPVAATLPAAAAVRDGAAGLGAGLYLLGYGESSDAHHMSTPHPDGLGAERALDDALARAGIDAAAVDHINLHGTASAKNDEVEAALVARRFPATTHASSTKGITGHTLGAAGIVEAAASLLAIEHGLRPGTANTRVLDPACGPQVRIEAEHAPVRVALSNSFGFGGNNCILVFGDADAGGSR
jgi:3-oxoacyl-[acyl-carrier-protein] synthase I